MSDLAAEICHPGQSPAGRQSEYKIEDDQPSGEWPAVPPTDQSDQRQHTDNSSGHQSDHPGVFVTLEVWFASADGSFDRLLRSLSRQVREARRQTGEHEYAQGRLLDRAVLAPEAEPQQEGAERDAQDRQVSNN
jgi:hypothetical protein